MDPLDQLEAASLQKLQAELDAQNDAISAAAEAVLQRARSPQHEQAVAELLGAFDPETGERRKGIDGLRDGYDLVLTSGNLERQVEWLDLSLGQGHYLFSRGATLVRVVPAEQARSDGVVRAARSMIAVQASVATIRTLFGQQAQGLDAHGRSRPERYAFLTTFAMYKLRTVRVGPNRETAAVLTDAPKEAAAAFRELGSWRHVRPLRGISRWPLLAADGTLNAKEGYDFPTRYYIADAAGLERVEVLPREELRRQVLAMRADELRDFAFSTDDDFAAYLAALLTPMVLAACPTRPAFIFDAPTVGSGKTLTAQAIGTIYNGEPIAANPLSTDEEERRKVVMSLLLAADPFVLFDNVKSTIGGPTLAALVTSEKFSDRKLGSNETASLDVSCMVLITANNAATDIDFARRAVRIRLDPQVENTMTRRYAYPDLHRTLAERRPKLLRLLASILVSYAAVPAAERPKGVVPFASYQRWAAVVRDAVVWLGFNDFVARAALDFEQANPELEALAGALTALREKFGGSSFTAASVVAAAKAEGDGWRWEGKFGAAVLDAFGYGREESLTAVQLGRAMGRRRDQIAAGMVLRVLAKPGSSTTFRVASVGAPTAATDEEREASCEGF
ncbi:hypothetical protein [Inhella crocodyli]|uniref:Uncharacterized protein n=1 Tax=Inhella crocodyli TaxID=2499851 RepID=A0A3S2UF29_9BURK|nr:hypothetical protein [Inhella crocodyli]RVT86249.1 hypothetical protein EOD73_09460 [Inhella crocodyli]